MERKQGWKTGPIVLQNYSLLCYKLLFVLIRFSLFLHLFVFSFYLRAVVKVTCRFFFYFFSLFFAKWVCIMYAIMAFFFFFFLTGYCWVFIYFCFFALIYFLIGHDFCFNTLGGVIFFWLIVCLFFN